jgi:hypothetical protein
MRHDHDVYELNGTRVFERGHGDGLMHSGLPLGDSEEMGKM